MILIFLGSWRSTLIIAVSIPLSILVSLIVAVARSGETHQHHDARRPRARRRHPGRRRDRRDREHQPQPRARARRSSRPSSTAPRRSRCRRSSRRSAICIVFVPMFFLTRRRALPLHARSPRPSCFAMLAVYFLSRTLVPTMAQVPAARPRARRRAGQARRRPRRPLRPLPARLRAALRALPRRLPRASLDAAHRPAPVAFASVFLAVVRWSRSASCSRGSGGLLPRRRQRPVQAAPARAAPGPASRRRPRLCDAIDGAIREVDPAGRARHDHRQHRRALQRPQPLLQQLGADRAGRRRHPGLAEGEAPPDRRATSRRCATASRSEFPGVDASTSCRSTWSARS